MSETWGWFIDIENEYEYKNYVNYKNQIKNTLLHNIPDTIYEEKEYYIESTDKNNKNQIKNDKKKLSEIIDPFTVIILILLVSGYILMVI
jgi:hypothetical protein